MTAQTWYILWSGLGNDVGHEFSFKLTDAMALSSSKHFQLLYTKVIEELLRHDLIPR
jgi:hypothetical protein